MEKGTANNNNYSSGAAESASCLGLLRIIFVCHGNLPTATNATTELAARPSAKTPHPGPSPGPNEQAEKPSPR